MQSAHLNWVEIPQHLLIKDHQIHLITLPEHSFCLVYLDSWYAFAPKCPHASAPLINGWCEDKQVVCSYHRRQYDLETGRGAEGQGDYLQTYPLKEQGHHLYIGLKTSWWQRMFVK